MDQKIQGFLFVGTFFWLNRVMSSWLEESSRALDLLQAATQRLRRTPTVWAELAGWLHASSSWLTQFRITRRLVGLNKRRVSMQVASVANNCKFSGHQEAVLCNLMNAVLKMGASSRLPKKQIHGHLLHIHILWPDSHSKEEQQRHCINAKGPSRSEHWRDHPAGLYTKYLDR